MSDIILTGTWIQHPIYEDYYFSSNGEVMSRKNGKFRMLKGTVCGQSGYKAICVEGKKKIYIHRTVCELFNGPQPDGYQCRHLDGNNTNNKASNLKWGTPSENARDKILHGTYGSGQKNSMAKLTEKQVNTMRSIREKLKTPYHEIAKMYGVSTMTAFRAVTKRSWK
jgi:hypothetical protein